MDPLEPESFIDRVGASLKQMPKQLCSVSEGDLVQIIDTPHVWGEPMTEEGVAVLAKAAVQALADTVCDMVAGAEERIDILSLNPADGVFLAAVKRGLKKLAKRLAKEEQVVTVRFLFGWVPTRDTVAAFRADLAKFCRANQIPTDQFTIVIGQYYSYRQMFWNHAKIVAVDGKVALVGGHNLWDSAYGNYPPVHDISVHVTGDAAKGAHGFADFLWDKGGDYLVIWSITRDYQVIEKGSRKERDYQSMDRQIELIDLSVVRGPSTLTIVEEPDLSSLGQEVELVDFGAAKRAAENRPPAKTGRVMSLGRCGGLASGAFNASDEAKRVIILNARRSLKFCQQDLLFRGAKGKDGHQVCHWIAQALLLNPQLTVQIVVSPIDASGAGDQYSWGSGAIGTHQLLCELIRDKSHDGRQAAEAIERLHVAPFCFTEVGFDAEGKDYQWPDVPKKVWAGRFGLTVPTPSVETFVPAPGNHAKVFIADDSVFYVGSDNLYPHDLAEFGYLIEGEVVEVFLRDYWDQVWRYAKAHCIGERHGSTTFSMTPIPVDPRVVQRNKEIAEELDEVYEL
jgi:murine toxin